MARDMPYIDAVISAFSSSQDEPNAAEQAIAFDASLERSGWVIVPQSALDWLNGEGPDPDGKWFGDAEPPIAPGKTPRRYWWRTKFRELLGLGVQQSSNTEKPNG